MLGSRGSAAVIEMLISKGSVVVLEITYCDRECFEVLGARVGDFGGQAVTRVYRFWQMTVAKQARHQRRAPKWVIAMARGPFRFRRSFGT